eukprot:tig00020943_g16274.t1
MFGVFPAELHAQRAESASRSQLHAGGGEAEGESARARGTSLAILDEDVDAGAGAEIPGSLTRASSFLLSPAPSDAGAQPLPSCSSGQSSASTSTRFDASSFLAGGRRHSGAKHAWQEEAAGPEDALRWGVVVAPSPRLLSPFPCPSPPDPASSSGTPSRPRSPSPARAGGAPLRSFFPPSDRQPSPPPAAGRTARFADGPHVHARHAAPDRDPEAGGARRCSLPHSDGLPAPAREARVLRAIGRETLRYHKRRPTLRSSLGLLKDYGLLSLVCLLSAALSIGMIAIVARAEWVLPLPAGAARPPPGPYFNTSSYTSLVVCENVFALALFAGIHFWATHSDSEFPNRASRIRAYAWIGASLVPFVLPFALSWLLGFPFWWYYLETQTLVAVYCGLAFLLGFYGGDPGEPFSDRARRGAWWVLVELLTSGVVLAYALFVVPVYATVFSDGAKLAWRLAVHPLFFEVCTMLPVRRLVIANMQGEPSVVRSLAIVHAQSHVSTLGRIMIADMSTGAASLAAIVSVSAIKVKEVETEAGAGAAGRGRGSVEVVPLGLGEARASALGLHGPRLHALELAFARARAAAAGGSAQGRRRASALVPDILTGAEWADPAATLRRRRESRRLGPPPADLGVPKAAASAAAGDGAGAAEGPEEGRIIEDSACRHLFIRSVTLYTEILMENTALLFNSGLPLRTTFRQMRSRSWAFFGFAVYGVLFMGVLSLLYMGASVPRPTYCSSPADLCSCAGFPAAAALCTAAPS